MSHVSEEDELFAGLEGLETASMDPELTVLLEIVAIAQKRLDDDPSLAVEIMDDLNEQVPWMDQRVIINGNAFGPRLNDNHELQDSIAPFIDEPVVFKGFRIIHNPTYDDGSGPRSRPTLVYLFLVDEYVELNSDFLLTEKKNNLFAVAYIDAMHVHPERASPSYYANIAREYAGKYFTQIEAIAASSQTILDVMQGLSLMTMTPPKDDIEGEGLFALSEYAYHLLKIDKNLPYDVEIEGSYYTNASLGIFSEADEFDQGVIEDTSEMNVVAHTEGDRVRFLAGIEKLEPKPIPLYTDNDVIPTEALYWTVDFTIFGKHPSQDHTTRLGVPAPHIKNVISIRQQHAESKEKNSGI